jgi:hypothetical protein
LLESERALSLAGHPDHRLPIGGTIIDARIAAPSGSTPFQPQLS